MNLCFLVSNQTNPYLNIAVETYLVSTSRPDTVVLYLWRNRRTVVIGQNQNPFSEVNLDALLTDGGHLVRRRTGGGAVYHDDGNLNFSFVAPPHLYDQKRQFEVLQRAVGSFGLHTMLSGRNDVLVECENASASGDPSETAPSTGTTIKENNNSTYRKFSGNAFSIGRENNLHHGTILIQTHMDDLQRYLRPNPAKLLKHGVESVQSRVANLGQLCPDITAVSLQPRLLEAFEQVYGIPVGQLCFEDIVSLPQVDALREEYASEAWLYGHWKTFSAQRRGQFGWGSVEVSLTVSDDTIVDLRVATDALDTRLVDEARQVLMGASAAVRPSTDNPQVDDIVSLVYS